MAGGGPEIPEPMVFDLVRGLGALKGEIEVNALGQIHRLICPKFVRSRSQHAQTQVSLQLRISYPNRRLECSSVCLIPLGVFDRTPLRLCLSTKRS